MGANLTELLRCFNSQGSNPGCDIWSTYQYQWSDNLMGHTHPP